MAYEPKKFDALLGLEGFSDQLLINHFALYQGYVLNTNKLVGALEALRKEDKFSTPEFAELNRRFGWEFNGLRLHEYYFGNLTKETEPLAKGSELAKAITQEFGSYELFEKDFRSQGAMRGIGWIILYFDKESSQFFNVWINEHDTGHLAGGIPILIMDVFEHAYMTDYGIKRADYIEAFFKAVYWKMAEQRYKNAVS